MKPVIELKGISRTYLNGNQSLSVLKDINLTIRAGEMVAIIGASGSGKSTLMNIMGCLDVPDSGDYVIDGQNAAQLSADALAQIRREHIGFIFQRYHLMPDLSALVTWKSRPFMPTAPATSVVCGQPNCWPDWGWRVGAPPARPAVRRAAATRQYCPIAYQRRGDHSG